MNELLTIGIPTYNSLETLVSALESIESQLKIFPNYPVEIYVSDNCSKYDISFELAKYFDENFYNKLIININEENVGYDNNLQIIISESNGKYVKLLADDDLLDSNFLKDFFSGLAKLEYEPDMIISNFVFKTSDLQKIVKSEWFDSANEFHDKDLFKALNKINHAYGQVSSLVFKRESVLKLKPQFLKTNYIHVYWFFCLLENNRIEIFQMPNVIVRQGAPNWTGDGIINILTPLGGILAIEQSTLIDKKLKVRLIKQQMDYCFEQLTSIKNQNIKQRFLILFKFFPYAKYRLIYWFFWIPWILLPKFIRLSFKAIRKLIRKLLVLINSVYNR